MDIIPAILETDAAEVVRKARLIAPVAQSVQIDIADGAFTAQSTATLADIAQAGIADVGVGLEFHLMVQNPLTYMEMCQELGATRVFWHYEVAPDVKGMLAQLRRYSFKKGIAINPETDSAAIANDCGCMDAVQVMGVHPGSQGQDFIPATVERVRLLRDRFARLPIVVDGGVDTQTITALKDAGATATAVGSGIFACDDPIECYKDLLAMVNGS